ncbi:NUDIX domain-containing protein [Caldimonas thermodepolymerans]|uniref:NUDIX domain-containing protein n=1 Tax=Caldimonas thermodepolymerans TaxID=215580 RepID=UPI0022356939|nr:NUDIX hydrolase [Caldimonas thermodepolymerans]UZG43123.1 NUDIX hydrolase [Caldimonas thermodepolymerans]
MSDRTAPDTPWQRDDRHLEERRLESRQVFRGRLLDVRVDRIQLPDGQEDVREYVAHPGAVMIVPLLDDGRVVLERQYRYPLQRVMVEFPAGKLGPGEPGRACAERELFEETGYRAREWACAGRLNNAIAYSDETIQVWFARGLSAGDRHLDPGEFLDVFTATVDELAAWVRDGRVTDAKTMIGLLWLQQWRAGHWPLHWES